MKVDTDMAVYSVPNAAPSGIFVEFLNQRFYVKRSLLLDSFSGISEPIPDLDLVDDGFL